MKRNTIKTSVLLIVMLATGMYLAGCSKTASSINGTWNASSEREQKKVAGVTTLDTTIQITTSNQTILTLRSNGSYSVLSPGSSSGGVFTYANNKLTLVDTPSLSASVYNVTNLTGNALSVQSTDTNSFSPVATTTITINFTK